MILTYNYIAFAVPYTELLKILPRKPLYGKLEDCEY